MADAAEHKVLLVCHRMGTGYYVCLDPRDFILPSEGAYFPALLTPAFAFVDSDSTAPDSSTYDTRLSLRSDFLKKLTSLFAISEPSIAEGTVPTRLDVDENDWLSFLWYIHADPMDAEMFSASPASTGKCSRYLGVAIVAGLLDATEVAKWATQKALEMLTQPGRPFQVDTELARLLLSVASCYRGTTDCIITSVFQDVVCDALHPNRPGELSEDPIRVVEVARGNKFVLSHAYFYILLKGQNYDWKGDVRIGPVDRVRLLCGAYSLSRQNSWATSTFPSFTFSQPGALSDSAPHSPSPSVSGDGAASNPKAAHTGVPPATRPERGVSPELQATTSWHPEIDWQIMSARERLWSIFDEQQWALAT
ncbi:hypothetical protein AURDEDRAFT_176897 [Auricularia subglabra TFB-10046 SS5]|uniref:Uncharacterized protein n=1 Tax=Auricularia subglabra (strain TFB-10046 / SS5) TaxID=717982 RepID=J0CUN0_AURST|nr:hypothetical protein AURDEDRAFT_176897 [Auricularia subglabra TFB-10046 SS5]